MTSGSARALVVACALGALGPALAAPPASAAEPTAQDFATARALYKEGKELRAKGDLKGALEKLQKAHALGQTPITGMELAEVEVQLGMLVEAREVCLGIARIPVASDETQRSADARVAAAKLAQKLGPRLAALKIDLIGLQPGAVPVVTIDGVDVPRAALDEPRKANPGKHLITARVEGGETVTTTVDLSESQNRQITLAPPAAPEKAKPPPAGGPPVVVHKGGGVSGLTIAGLVVGGVGLVVGASAGLAAVSKSNGLNCPQDQCTPDQWDQLDAARALAAVSTVGFIGAGAGVVMVIIGIVTTKKSTTVVEQPRGAFVAPEVGAGWLGVHGAF